MLVAGDLGEEEAALDLLHVGLDANLPPLFPDHLTDLRVGDEGAGRRSRHGEATAVDQQQVPRLIGLKSAHFHPRPAHVLGSVRVCELK